MNGRARWSRLLVIVGLIAMLIGTIEPLEGSLVILPGSGMVALGALLSKSRHRRLLYWAFGLIATGVGAMFVLSGFGGTGGRSGRSNGWLLVVLPYPVGWIMGLAGVVLSLRESRLKHAWKSGPPQVQSRNMISSEEGLEVFRNWQTQQTLLWCLSVELSDFAHGPTVLIRVTCADPVGLVVTSDAWDEPLCLDLMDAEFEGFGRDESPFPDLPPERFVRLLSVRLADGRRFLFAEEVLD